MKVQLFFKVLIALFLSMGPALSIQKGTVYIYVQTDSSFLITEQNDSVFVLNAGKVELRLDKGDQFVRNTRPGFIDGTLFVRCSAISASYYLTPPLTKLPNQNLLKNDVYFNGIFFDTINDSLSNINYSDLKLYNKGAQTDVTSKNSIEELFSSRAIKSSMETFVSSCQLNTNQNAFGVAKNSLNINAHVVSMEHHTFESIHKIKMVIDYTLLDVYLNPIHTERIEVSSSDFQSRIQPVYIVEPIKKGLSLFLSNSSIQSMINGERETVQGNDKYQMKQISKGSRIEEVAKSVFTLKTPSGHGSACLVSIDGYIVTNYHVIKNETDILIFVEEEDSLTAEIIKVSPEVDLALLKVNRKFDHCLTFTTNHTPSIGTEIYVVGTPIDPKLHQSVTKGIVSSVPKIKDRYYYQTDAKVNGGNSGGAMINTAGELIGIVNAKIVGISVEGIGFAIPIWIAIEILNLNFKE